MESYRAMIGFRRETAALVTGRTRFFDLPEPVLGFMRGDGLLCLFNLSPDPVDLTVAGVSGLVGPSQAAVPDAGRVKLGGNGYGFFRATGPVVVTA